MTSTAAALLCACVLLGAAGCTAARTGASGAHLEALRDDINANPLTDLSKQNPFTFRYRAQVRGECRLGLTILHTIRQGEIVEEGVFDLALLDPRPEVVGWGTPRAYSVKAHTSSGARELRYRFRANFTAERGTVGKNRLELTYSDSAVAARIAARLAESVGRCGGRPRSPEVVAAAGATDPAPGPPPPDRSGVPARRGAGVRERRNTGAAGATEFVADRPRRRAHGRVPVPFGAGSPAVRGARGIRPKRAPLLGSGALWEMPEGRASRTRYDQLSEKPWHGFRRVVTCGRAVVTFNTSQQVGRHGEGNGDGQVVQPGEGLRVHHA